MHTPRACERGEHEVDQLLSVLMIVFF